jgi:phosphatidylinositol-3,4,5-trisphosphate 3-phosphatase/dual-specificity protein phosphatase PTEN
MHHNYMEDAIKYFESQHSGNYKVYNLCSEQLRDASILEGKGEWFPMDENNCPPLQLVTTFCRSAYKYLKAGLENVVVVHCKGGMAHAGLMISCLLLYLKVFATSLQFSQIIFNQSLLGYGNDLLKILTSAKQLRSIVWCMCVFL